MMIRAVILSQGNELTTGQTVDTNSTWLAAQLWDLGIEVCRIVTVPDSVEEIRTCFLDAKAKANIVICSGGLGPTQDDMTAEALGSALNQPLIPNPDLIKQLKERFAARGRVMSAINEKQALVPIGAKPLPNTCGTAPGLVYKTENNIIFCLPGVPHEMRAMFHASVVPELNNLNESQRPKRHIIHVIGIPESEMAEKLKGLNCSYATIGYRAGIRTHEVKLRFRHEAEPSLIEATIERAQNLLGPRAFAVNGGGLSQLVGAILTERQQTLATAESCTAGRIASWISETPGASRYLMEGVVVYSNLSKIRHCDVDPELIKNNGAVSAEVSISLAKGIRERASTTWGIGVTGIAGPGGGHPDKPVGTVHISVAGPSSVQHRPFRFHGNREQISQRSAAEALYLLYETIK